MRLFYFICTEKFLTRAYFDMEIHIVKKNKWMHQLNPEKFLIEVEGYYGWR